MKNAPFWAARSRFGIAPKVAAHDFPKWGYFPQKMRVLRAGALFLELEMPGCAPISKPVLPLCADVPF
jgi:hypothetical protein